MKYKELNKEQKKLFKDLIVVLNQKDEFKEVWYGGFSLGQCYAVAYDPLKNIYEEGNVVFKIILENEELDFDSFFEWFKEVFASLDEKGFKEIDTFVRNEHTYKFGCTLREHYRETLTKENLQFLGYKDPTQWLRIQVFKLQQELKIRKAGLDT